MCICAWLSYGLACIDSFSFSCNWTLKYLEALHENWSYFGWTKNMMFHFLARENTEAQWNISDINSKLLHRHSLLFLYCIYFNMRKNNAVSYILHFPLLSPSLNPFCYSFIQLDLLVPMVLLPSILSNPDQFMPVVAGGIETYSLTCFSWLFTLKWTFSIWTYFP